MREAMVSKHVKVRRQLDGTWTVYTSPSLGTTDWAIGADFSNETSAQRVADVIDREAIGFAGAPRLGEWCPVCHTYHVNPGEKTDAGKLVRQCPQIPAEDPRNVFANYPGRATDVGR